MPEDGTIAIIERLGAIAGKVDALAARVDERLDHGTRRMEDQEARLRIVEHSMPDGLETRLTALERFRWGAAGIAALVASLLSSGAASLIIWTLSRH